VVVRGVRARGGHGFRCGEVKGRVVCCSRCGHETGPYCYLVAELGLVRTFYGTKEVVCREWVCRGCVRREELLVAQRVGCYN